MLHVIVNLGRIMVNISLCCSKHVDIKNNIVWYIVYGLAIDYKSNQYSRQQIPSYLYELK